MKKNFFDHLIELDDLHEEIRSLDMSDDEKIHILKMVDESIHHTILDAILSELSDEDKKTFLKHLDSENHDTVWDFVNSRIESIEEKIKKAADDIKTELHTDVKSTKEGKPFE